MLKLIGYADRFSVAPGETVRFMVSALEDQPYQAEIVRLIHGDANPEGPGFKSERVPGGVEAAHVGRRQDIRAGSWARVPFHPRLKDLHSFTVAAMIWPTTPAKGRQGLIGHWDEEALAGWLLEIDEQGRLAARVGDGRAAVEVGSGVKLHRSHWYLAAMIYDAAAGTLTVIQRPVTAYGVVRTTATSHRPPPPRSSRTARSRWRRCAPAMASAATTTAGSTARASSPRPCRRSGWRGCSCSPLPADLTGSTLAAWDFAQEIKTTRIVDAGPEGLDGEIVNLPTRAIRRAGTGPAPSIAGGASPSTTAPSTSTTTTSTTPAGRRLRARTVPDDLRVGRLRRPRLVRRRRGPGRDEDYIPFFVRPPRGAGGKSAGRGRLPRPDRVLHRLCQPRRAHRRRGRRDGDGPAPGPTSRPTSSCYEHPELGGSLYDSHGDGSGVCLLARGCGRSSTCGRSISSWLGGLGSGLWQFNADTHSIDWLEHQGVEPTTSSPTRTCTPRATSCCGPTSASSPARIRNTTRPRCGTR